MTARRQGSGAGVAPEVAAGTELDRRTSARDGASLGRPRRRDGKGDRAAFTVREATIADLSTVVELRLALLRENGDHPIYGRLRADAYDRAHDLFGAQLHSAHEVMFLAEREGQIVGILRCVDTPNSPLLHPARYCYVSSVYVRPNVRRRGVLKALLRHAADWCIEHGLHEMRLHNVPGGSASAAWEAEGFEVMEEVRRRVIGTTT